jgi:hypothetical protein
VTSGISVLRELSAGKNRSIPALIKKPTKPPTQRRNRNPQAQHVKPQLIPVGGFVGFCPSSFTVSAVFHQTGDNLEIVL